MEQGESSQFEQHVLPDEMGASGSEGSGSEAVKKRHSVIKTRAETQTMGEKRLRTDAEYVEGKYCITFSRDIYDIYFPFNLH